MSLFIYGMEMPKQNDALVVREINGKVYIKHEGHYGFEGRIVEIKEPHGRLGDLDELWDKMYNYIDNEGARMPFGDNDFMIHRDSACELIEDAPTVIEAEGRG